MKRRSFLGLLGVSAAAVLIPERSIFLPPWPRVHYGNTVFPPDWNFVSAKPEGGVILYDNTHPTVVDLSEASIERMLIELRQMTDDRGIALSLKPTRRVVSPAEYRWITGE